MRRSVFEATAYHEAGHALAAIVQGVPFEYVSIKSDADRGSAGHVMFKKWRRRSLDAHFAKGVVTMAGEASQRRFTRAVCDAIMAAVTGKQWSTWLSACVGTRSRLN